MKDVKGRHTLANPQAQYIFQKSLKDILGKTDKELFSQEEGLSIMRADQKVLKSGKSREFEEILTINGKRYYFLSNKTPIENSSGESEGLIVIKRDITALKELEKRKDEFIGIASHELKTPLTSIKGYLQILQNIIKDGDLKKAKLIAFKTDLYVGRLNDLICDLLDVTKIQSGKMQLKKTLFDFNEVIEEGIASIQPISNGHKIIKKGSINKKIIGDRDRLEQVFANLLSNAIKYSPNSDKIIIELIKNKKQIIVNISDFGIGIPKAEQRRIFERFYRVHDPRNNFSGLGIGLHISYEIIKRHGGKMWVKSDLNKGSSFYFSLPLRQYEN